MTLLRTDDLVFIRKRRIILLTFLTPHRVLSTGRVNGGMRDDILTAGNCQICEPRGHMPKVNDKALADPIAYHEEICLNSGIDPSTSVLLLTAADMQNAAVIEEKNASCAIRLVCTAGVETNAVRAGDPASLGERDGTFHAAGTINIILSISNPLTEGAFIQAAVTAAEAKAAILQELLVYSRYSPGLATGTGTDGIIIASPLNGESQLTDAGTHTQLGECIASAVKKGIKQALALQNGLTPDSLKSTGKLAARFGIHEEQLIEDICALLPPEEASVFRLNQRETLTNPAVFASVSAFLHCLDLVSFGVLPIVSCRELLAAYAAQTAAAVSEDALTFPEHLNALSGDVPFPIDNVTMYSESAGFIAKAIALGFLRRWRI